MKRAKQILIIAILLSVIGVMAYAYLRSNTAAQAKASENSQVMTANAVKKKHCPDLHILRRDQNPPDPEPEAQYGL